MNDKEINGKKIYCCPAQPKAERKKQIAQESYKYKNSKKRCNLYVRNIQDGTTQEAIYDLFVPYGEIESVKVLTNPDQKSTSAFVCFRTPEGASGAKNGNLHFNDRPLIISHYEIKEQRDLLKEAE